MNFDKFLTELRYEDTYPKSFLDFRKKYTKLMKEHKAYRLYVQFHNVHSDTMNRNPHASPDHNDPMGVYAYPLEYVLKHPSDIWYGANSRYMRILKDTSRKTLHLNDIDRQDRAISVLMKMGFSYNEIQNFYLLLRKFYKERYDGSQKEAKKLLAIIQIDFTSEPVKKEGFGKTRFVYRVRTSKEQSELLMKAGYDSVIDLSKTDKQAVINDREPEQIIFLNRGAFRVIEVYDLRGSLPDKKLGVHTVNMVPDTLIRKIAAKIAMILDDKISEGPERQSLNGWSYFWTKKGRRIEIEETKNYDNDSSNKKHRKNKLYNEYFINVVVQTELGKIDTYIEPNEKIDVIFYDIRKQWINLNKNPEHGWQKQTMNDYQLDRTKKIYQQYLNDPSRFKSDEDYNKAIERYKEKFGEYPPNVKKL